LALPSIEWNAEWVLLWQLFVGYGALVSSSCGLQWIQCQQALLTTNHVVLETWQVLLMYFVSMQTAFEAVLGLHILKMDSAHSLKLRWWW
jgi:hypothetical protein